MYQHKHTVILTVILLVGLLTTGVCAKSVTVNPADLFCFSAEDFTTTDTDEGIFLTSLPKASIATVHHGSRVLKAGDAVPLQDLKNLTMTTHCITAKDTAIGYYTVSNGAVSGAKELKLSILPKKNEAPKAGNETLETYRNIPNSGTLPVSDPENGTMTYSIVTQPKRGTVEIQTDGTYTYTPFENKVGKDHFTFIATDDAGNISNEGKISIEIKKPTDREVYADLTESDDLFPAMWLKEQGIFTGSRIGGNLCFEPEKTVSRGEFLVMAMGVVKSTASNGTAKTGFADEAETPHWMQPYIVSALSGGMISGTKTEDGIRFLPRADLTKAEACVMLQNALRLPVADVQQVSAFADTSLPTWAKDAVAALSANGIQPDISTSDELMTRRDVATILYKVGKLLQSESAPDLYWVQ